MMNFKGKARKIDDVDLPLIGQTIGVGEDELHALMDVEAAGSGFDGQGRPKALFEPHLFWRFTSGEARRRAVEAGLAYERWKRDYPKDSYPRIEAASAIDETAALKATSWGRSQILGMNHALIGYGSPQDMVRAFCDDEENHIRGMVDFIKANGIDDDLRRHDWRSVARVYNGPGYEANAYHTRLAQAYGRWAKIKDTPLPAELPAEDGKRAERARHLADALRASFTEEPGEEDWQEIADDVIVYLATKGVILDG